MRVERAERAAVAEGIAGLGPIGVSAITEFDGGLSPRRFDIDLAYSFP